MEKGNEKLIEELEKLKQKLEESLKRYRERVVQDLPKGEKFESELERKIKEYTGNGVVIARRNRWIGVIPTNEYVKYREKYKRLINRTDLCILFKGEPQCGVECGLRKTFYYNPYQKPHCECKSWDDGKHVNVPLVDLERYLATLRTARQKYPWVKLYICIKIESTKEIIFVKLEDWENTCFEDWNDALRDNTEQSIVCLKKTSHFDSFEEWAKAVGLPKASRG